MEELMKEMVAVEISREIVAGKVLELICKRKYGCLAAANELEIEEKELRLRLREELKLYRGKK